MNMKNFVLGAAFLLAALIGTAQHAADCAAVPEAYRAKCEAAMGARDACAGKTGEERKKCILGNTDYSKFNQCDKENDAAKKAACNDRTRVEKICAGKLGNELKACIHSNVKHAHGR